jgi:hypothetical protein
VEVAQIVLNYLKVLTWPMALMVMVFLLRHRLADLVGRLTSAEAFGTKVEFTAQVAAAEATLGEAQTSHDDSVDPVLVQNLGSFTPQRPDLGEAAAARRATRLLNMHADVAMRQDRLRKRTTGATADVMVTWSFIERTLTRLVDVLDLPAREIVNRESRVGFLAELSEATGVKDWQSLGAPLDLLAAAVAFVAEPLGKMSIRFPVISVRSHPATCNNSSM